jgi:acetolactate synthase small subunit
MSQFHQLELDVRDDPGVLLRVVGTCHKRGITISSLHYEPAGCGGRIVLCVPGDAARADRLGQWLAAIVPVLDVRPGQPRAD